MKKINEELKKAIKENYWDRNDKLLEKILREIKKIIDWKFRLLIKWVFDKKDAEKMFKFLKDKERTCSLSVNNHLEYSIQASLMDIDFLIKYYKDLFNPKNYEYILTDTKKTIKIFEGGIEIKSNRPKENEN